MQKVAIVYFEPDNIVTTRINGTVEEIEKYYPIGDILNLGYDDKHPDGYPHKIKGIEIKSLDGKLLFFNGDTTSKYKKR